MFYILCFINLGYISFWGPGYFYGAELFLEVTLRGMFFVKAEYLLKNIPIIKNENVKAPERCWNIWIFYYDRRVKMGDLKRRTFLHFEWCFLVLFYFIIDQQEIAMKRCLRQRIRARRIKIFSHGTVHSSTLFPSAQLSCRSKLSFSAQKTFPSAQLVPYPPSTAVLKGRMTSECRGSAKAWKKKISRSLIFLTENNDGPTCHNARKKNHPGTLTHAIACHTQKHTHI